MSKTIEFKNGSYIKVIESNEVAKSTTIRGYKMTDKEARIFYELGYLHAELVVDAMMKVLEIK